jgi:hypothetical protein
MQKPVAIVDQELELKGLVRQLDAIHQHFNQKSEFINKQMEDLNKEHELTAKPYWEKIESYLKNNGRLPDDYSPDKYHLHFVNKDQLLVLCDGDHDQPAGIPAIIELLTGPKK